MKLKFSIAFVVIALVAVGAYFLKRSHARLPVTVTIRVLVAPDDRVGYVAGQANSAKFKYLMGKQSGVKPVFAQKLTVKPVPNSKLLEAQVSVNTKDEGTRYAAAFADSLQYVCGTDAHITIASQTVH